MAYSRAKTAAPGRHSRPSGAGEVRRTCLAVLTMLIAQYALGVFLDLFVTIPAAARHAGLVGEITSGPFALTVHALLGLALLGTAIMLLARAVRLEDGMLIALSTGALAAIGGAFAAGEIFVKNGGQDSASFTMALLAGVAMLCYVLMLALIGAPQRRHARVPDGPPAHARTAPGLLASQDRDWTEPGPDPDWSQERWSQQSWPGDGWADPSWPGQARPDPGWPGPAGRGPAGPEPAWAGQQQYQQPPPPLPVRRPQERTVVGVTWEAPWSRGPADRR